MTDIFNAHIKTAFLGEIAGVQIDCEQTYTHLAWFLNEMATSEYFVKLFANPKFNAHKFVEDYIWAFDFSWRKLDDVALSEMESQLHTCLSYFDEFDPQDDNYPKFMIYGNEMGYDSFNINLHENAYIDD